MNTNAALMERCYFLSSTRSNYKCPLEQKLHLHTSFGTNKTTLLSLVSYACNYDVL